MMRCAALGLSVSLIWASTGFAYSEENAKTGPQDCRLHVVAALDMRTMTDGRVTVPAQFNGYSHRLMVDTGGYVNTVTSQLVVDDAYSTRVGDIAVRGVGSRRLNSAIDVLDFSLGKSHIRNSTFYVDVFGSQLADGTLAPEIMANYDVDLDFGHDKLNLIGSDHCPGQVVYWTKDQTVTVPFELEGKAHIRSSVTLDGKKVMALIDTGSVTSLMTMRAATRLLGITPQSPGLLSLGTTMVNGVPSTTYLYTPETLSLGSINLHGATIHIVSDSLWDKDDLLLGIDLLRPFHLYVAYGEKRLYLSPALAK